MDIFCSPRAIKQALVLNTVTKRKVESVDKIGNGHDMKVGKIVAVREATEVVATKSEKILTRMGFKPMTVRLCCTFAMLS